MRTFSTMQGALLSAGYIALLLFVIRRSRFFALPELRKRHLAGIFLVKVAAGTALWWIYTFHFTDRSTADIYKYFDDSKVMYDALWTAPSDFLRMLFGIANDNAHFSGSYYHVMNNWMRKYESNLANDSHTMIRFNALVRVFSGGHFSVHTVFAAFLAFTGMTAICKAFAAYLPGRRVLLYVAVFLLPSVLFWASGVIKESLLLFALGLLLWKLFAAMEGRARWSDAVVVAPLLLLLFFLKFYVLLSMVPALIALAWCRLRPGRAFLKYGIALVASCAIALHIHHVIPGFNILQVLWWKQHDFIGLARLMDSGSFVMPPAMEPSLGSFLKNAPYALYMCFLGPLAHVGQGPLGLLSAVETAVILLAVVFLLARRQRQGIDLALVLFCLCFALALALVIGWTTPVVGAIVRYRVPLLPFVLIAALLLTDPKRLPVWMRASFAP